MLKFVIAKLITGWYDYPVVEAGEIIFASVVYGDHLLTEVAMKAVQDFTVIKRSLTVRASEIKFF